MATPSKPNPGTTPTHLTSSPRPAGTLPRPISHKSPSARTPSTSGPAHGYQPNPSHQYSTPLATATGADDPVNFSSPSALMALGSFSGISPANAGHDGLGGAIHESDIQALGMQGLKLGGGRDSDEERRRHIEDVVQLLRSRVVGRGVSREAVERLGQLEGFESFWQGDSINIAGRLTDLEIEFHPKLNVVKNVILKVATPGATDGEPRREATEVLQRNLVQAPEDGERGAWKSLAVYHENIQWLARHDRLSSSVSCFGALEGLYESLRRIWDAEEKNPRYFGEYEHICTGRVGRPGLHRVDRLGLVLDYWVQQARILDAKQKKSAEKMEIDHPSGRPSDRDSDALKGKWSVVIECEEGYPYLRVSKDWVESEPLTTLTNAAAETSSNEAAGSDDVVVNWADPPETLVQANQDDTDAMAIDSNMLSTPPNRRFVARMEPPLDLPILAASDIYQQLGIQMLQNQKMVTYDGLLAPGWSPLAAAGAWGLGPEEASQIGRKRRKMSVSGIDVEGKPCKKQHSYTFQPFESVAGRTIRDIPFSHPRQLTEIFPILRQYAFLANLIRKIFRDDNMQDAKDISTSPAKSQVSKESEKVKSKGHVTVLSNENPHQRKLDLLLGGVDIGKGDTLQSTEGNDDHEPSDEDDVKVDVTLRTQLGQAPVIMLLFTVGDTKLGASTPDKEWTKVSISLEIGFNGRVSVVDMTGLLDEDSTGKDVSDSQADGAQKNEKLELQDQMARALEISQDIGILVEWILRWVRQRKER